MVVKLHHADDDLLEKHEINVTPFIDVMLVLLIIFMVAAPLATVDISVNLPSASASPRTLPEKPIYLTVKADRSLGLGNETVSMAGLANALDKFTNHDKTQTVFLRADKTVDYGLLMQVMNTLRTADYLKIALVALDQNQN